jgi:hypothetical protein
MRFDSSTETSHSVAAGTSPVFDQATVGKDISSATQGSSVASVAGKKRGPTKQCAKASAAESARNTSANANAREQLEERSMNNLHWRLEYWRPVAAASFHSTWGGPRERLALRAAAGSEIEWVRGLRPATKTCGITSAGALGATAVGIEVVQPMQQQSAQIALPVPSGEGAG